MKRLSIALAALGLSAGALAAYPAATDPTIVNVPELPGGFFIGGSAYYLQPSATNGSLDYASVNSGTTSSFFSSLKKINPSYDWGWGANIGYIFPQTGNDINLSWFTLNTNDNSSVITPTGSSIDTIFFTPGFLGVTQGFITRAAANVKYDLDQVDLTAGQYVDVGCHLILHPNVGLRWADVQRKMNVLYSGPSAVVTSGVTNIFNVSDKSDFSGIGPLVGLDASYYLGYGFGAVAHVDSALLVGDMDISATTRDTGLYVVGLSNVTINAFNNFNGPNSRRIVPVVDGKLGADYTFVFNNTANSDLTFEAGWMISEYFNAIDKMTTVSGTATILSGISGRSTSDLALQGPYVSLQLHI